MESIAKANIGKFGGKNAVVINVVVAWRQLEISDRTKTSSASSTTPFLFGPPGY